MITSLSAAGAFVRMLRFLRSTRQIENIDQAFSSFSAFPIGMSLSHFDISGHHCSALSIRASQPSFPQVLTPQVFFRSETVHSESMTAIMKTMSTDKAWNILEKSNLTSPALVEVAGGLVGKQSHLRKQPKGYAGLDGATGSPV